MVAGDGGIEGIDLLIRAFPEASVGVADNDVRERTRPDACGQAESARMPWRNLAKFARSGNVRIICGPAFGAAIERLAKRAAL